MFTRSLVRRAAAVGVVALVATACSSGGSKGGSTDPSGWHTADLAVVRNVAHRISTAFPGQCTKIHTTSRSEYIGGSRKVGGPYPEAVISCDGLDENLEISAFTDASERERFVTQRSSKLCALSKEKQVGLPGLYWVDAPNWSVQPDSEGVARRVAHALGAQYFAYGCEGTNPGWNNDSVALLETAAGKIAKANDGCTDFQLEDRDLVSRSAPFDKIGTPGAVGICTLANKGTVILAAYATPTGANTEKLVQGEFKRDCGGSKTTRIVRAGSVAAFATSPEIARKIAGEIGGKMTDDVCPTA
jgi:hypothetical protein